MLRQSLLLGVAGMAFAGASAAQQRGQSRDDLLDALTRHIQICGEMTDTQSRLACYDRLQTQVGGVTPQAQPTPTPLPPAAPTPLRRRRRRAAAAAADDHGIGRLVDQLRAAHAAAARRAGRRRGDAGRRRRRQPAAVDDAGSQRRLRSAHRGLSAARDHGRPAAAATAAQRAAARPQLLDAAAAGDAGRHQPDLRRFALLAGDGDAHLQHAHSPSTPRPNAPS